MAATNQEIVTKANRVNANQTRLYVISPYYPDYTGKLLPDLPTIGPCQEWDDRACRICIDHDRDRKTGPGFPIRVVR